MLSLNPNAIHLLEKNQDKIHWFYLSRNPNAIHLLEQNLDKIHWRELSENPNAISILEQNLDKIHWFYLSGNPSIITYDYIGLKERMDILREQLMMAVFHPKRLECYLDMGYDIGEDEYILGY